MNKNGHENSVTSTISPECWAKQNIPYIETIKNRHNRYRKPLNPTGKWKLESGPWYENKIFIQHKGWIFKRWISEDSIVFAPAKKAEKFNCEISCYVCGYRCIRKGDHGCIGIPVMVKT